MVHRFMSGPFDFKVGYRGPSGRGRACSISKWGSQVRRVRSGPLGFKVGFLGPLGQVGPVRFQCGVAKSVGSGLSGFWCCHGLGFGVIMCENIQVLFWDRHGPKWALTHPCTVLAFLREK